MDIYELYERSFPFTVRGQDVRIRGHKICVYYMMAKKRL